MNKYLINLSLYCIVRWLSTYDVLNRFVVLLKPIIAFLDEKKQSYPQLKDKDWIYDLMFFTDTMEHLKKLNISLQGNVRFWRSGTTADGSGDKGSGGKGCVSERKG